MQTITKAATPNYKQSSTFAPISSYRIKIKGEWSFYYFFFSNKPLNSQWQGKNNFWKSVLFVFRFWCIKSPKVVEDKRMLVGVCMTSFRYFVFGVWKREEDDKYIQLCSLWCFQSEISLPCKPVPLSYAIYSADYLCQAIWPCDFNITLKVPALRTGSNFTFTKAA